MGPTATELTGLSPEACSDDLLTKPDDVSGCVMKDSRDEYVKNSQFEIEKENNHHQVYVKTQFEDDIDTIKTINDTTNRDGGDKGRRGQSNSNNPANESDHDMNNDAD